MFLKVIRDLARPQWFEIIRCLKRSTGMSVKELAEELKMSYMGIKQHCVEMQKKGYLDTWRRPKPVGRPEKVYRLTGKTQGLFPEIGNELTIDVLHAVRSLYGNTAPDKLLMAYFQKKTEYYLKRVKGESVDERATSFAKIRNLEGYLGEYVEEPDGGTMLVEFHSPFESLGEKFPSLWRLEEQMVERVIGTKVARDVEQNSGLTKYVFHVSAGIAAG